MISLLLTVIVTSTSFFDFSFLKLEFLVLRIIRMLLISCSFVSAGARESQGDRFTKPETNR